MAADELIVTMTPSPPGIDGVQLRVTPQYADELQEVLESKGVYQGRAAEFSAEVTLAILVATLGTNGWPAISAALVAFFDRHKNVKVELYEDGTVKSISGTSLQKAEQLIEVTQLQKGQRDAQWRHLSAGSSSELSQDPGEHRPAGPIPGS